MFYKRKEYEDLIATLKSFKNGSPGREEYLKQRKETTLAIQEVRI
jgi:hypothetical protein